jgi:hypothetical protein
LADSTGNRISFNLSAGATGGDWFLVHFVGATFGVPALFNAGTGTTIENPQNPGVFSATAGTVAVSSVGATVAWEFDGTNSRWAEYQ